jgi:hypothetical protein
LAEKAGLPWHIGEEIRRGLDGPIRSLEHGLVATTGPLFTEANARYIVAACNALPALLDRLDKAEAALSVERIAQALRVHRPLDNGTCSCRKWTFGKESLTEIFTEHQAKGVRAALTSTDKETQG